ncbi:MAG: ribosomal protection-like ABC-F family protein [Planctomycetota bacterium]
MLLVNIQNATKAYAGKTVLDGISFNLSEGRRIGLIGPNGTGKTTLLRIIAGQEQTDDGHAAVTRGVRVGYVPQHVEFDPRQTVGGCLLESYTPVAELLARREHELAEAAEAERPEALRRYQAAMDAHERMGGYAFPARAQGMLDAMGLPGRGDQFIRSLSGGEKNVVALARALLLEPDLLLLDEPANHLDYQGVAWLEDFLLKFKGAVLIVSHNRYLLDRVVHGVYHLERGSIKYYDGGYTAYRAALERDRAAQLADYKANQKMLTRMEEQVQRIADQARNRADTSLGRRLRSRRSRLEREKAQAVDRPDRDADPIGVAFRAGRTQADIALRLKGYTRIFGDHILFEGAEAEIYCGERVALVGPNGCGKSTLLKDIIARGDWENPVIRVGPSLSMGYCAQEQEVLDGGRTLLEEIHAAGDLKHEQAMAMLGRFRFTGLDLTKRVGDLSGGERNRLQLARLMVQQPNFLILDEPTNHLDIPMCEAVEEALDDFKGTLLVVSHDRYFLDKVVDRVLEVHEQGLVPYGGNFTDFWNIRHPEEASATDGRLISRGRERTGALPRKERAVRRGEFNLSRIEGRITAAEIQKSEAEQAMLDAYQSSRTAEGNRLAAEMDTLAAEIESLYAELMNLEERQGREGNGD